MERSKKDKDSQMVELSKRYPDRFEYIYRAYKARLFNFFYQKVGSKEVAGDLTQETFMRAFKARNDFKYKGYPYAAYIFRIARNLLVNYYKKKKPISLDRMDVHPYFTPSYYDKLEGDMLWRSVERLSLIERRVLEDKYKKGRTVREIARKVNKSENAVKLILSRARKKLKKRHFSERVNR